MYFVPMEMFLAHRYKRKKAAVVDNELIESRRWGLLILFTSSTTLLCCALPILFVSLGMGAVVASIYGDYFPWLRWFGLNGGITFGVTFAILALAGWVLFKPGRSCPADPQLAIKCNSARKWNLRFYWSSLIIWCVGAVSAFVLPLFI